MEIMVVLILGWIAIDSVDKIESICYGYGTSDTRSSEAKLKPRILEVERNLERKRFYHVLLYLRNEEQELWQLKEINRDLVLQTIFTKSTIQNGCFKDCFLELERNPVWRI
jgi:hypothetical protein